MCWSLVASLLKGQDTTLQHSQLSATKAMEAGLQTTRLMVRVLGSRVILSVALWISMPRCFLLMHRQAARRPPWAPGYLDHVEAYPVQHPELKILMQVPWCPNAHCPQG